MTDTQASSERGQREFVPVTFLCPVDKARLIGKQAGRSLISRSKWLRRAVESRLEPAAFAERPGVFD
jgi:hypothetical protein